MSSVVRSRAIQAPPPPPKNGVFVYGLFLEGARWDDDAGFLAEMRPGHLYHRMPSVWLEPVSVKVRIVVMKLRYGREKWRDCDAVVRLLHGSPRAP